MKLRIDYHFHPNLPKNDENARKKCKNIWQKFQEKNIKYIVVTEHAYKNPKRAYNLMIKEKPENYFCFPGIECITKEGIDIIVFSNTSNIYNYRELKPFNLLYFELIDFVNSKNNLYAFVTHPYTLGLTSVINKLGEKVYIKSLNLLNAVEISNGAFDNLFFLISKFPLNFIFRSKLKKIIKSKNLPKSDYPKNIKFLVAGSDAHYAEEIGNCYEINYSGNLTKDSIFKIITNNLGGGKPYSERKKFSLILLLKTAFTASHEFFIKTILKNKIKLNDRINN